MYYIYSNSKPRGKLVVEEQTFTFWIDCGNMRKEMLFWWTFLASPLYAVLVNWWVVILTPGSKKNMKNARKKKLKSKTLCTSYTNRQYFIYLASNPSYPGKKYKNSRHKKISWNLQRKSITCKKKESTLIIFCRLTYLVFILHLVPNDIVITSLHVRKKMSKYYTRHEMYLFSFTPLHAG